MLIVSIGTGAPARIDSSKKMNCSIARAALAAVLLGPADADPAVGRHLLPDRGAAPAPTPCDPCELGHGLRVEQLLVVVAQLLLHRHCSGVYPISMRTPVFCQEAFLTDLQIVVYYSTMATIPLAPLTGKRILVTGVTGMVAGPMAAQLAAADNTVYGGGALRRSRPARGARSHGVTTIRVDLEHGELDEVPDDLDYVLHFAVAKTNDFGRDLAANADGAAHLMERVQGVDGFFHCSSGGVYQEHEHDHLKEDAPLGDSHRAAGMESYSISKIAAETHGAVHRQAPRHPHRHRAAQRAVRRHLRLAVLPRDDARARHGDPRAHRRTVAVQPAQPRRHRGVAPLPAGVGVDAGERRELGRRRGRERRGVVRPHR